MVFNSFYINVLRLFVNIFQRPIISINTFKKIYTYIFKCLQYNNNRADIWMQLNGALAFLGLQEPPVGHIYQTVISQQHLPSNVRSLVSVNHVTSVYILSAVPRQKQCYCSTPRKSIQNQLKKTPTLMCIQSVWLVQSLRLIHGFIKVSEHCYSAKMMPTFLFCCFALIWARWGRCNLHVADI